MQTEGPGIEETMRLDSGGEARAGADRVGAGAGFNGRMSEIRSDTAEP
jgi:hypothetical protein